MSRCLLRVSIDDSADRGRISEPVPETDSNEAFEIRRREAPPLAAGSLALEDEMARSVAISVVPEPQKASSTMPPRLEQSRIASSTSATGLTVGCRASSASRSVPKALTPA